MIDILQDPCYLLFQPSVVRKSKISFVHTGWVQWMPLSLAEVTIMFYGHVFQDSVVGLVRLLALTLTLLMSYIYIYIYMELLVKPEILTSYIYIYIYGPTFVNAESRLFVFAAQCFNTEPLQSGFLCHICV
jgi:hypothetical protein